MTILPGDIYYDVEITSKDRKYNYFNVKGETCHISDRDAAGIILKKGSILRKVISCGIHDKRHGFRFSINTYIPVLIEKLYRSGRRGYLKCIIESKKDVWIRRWKDAAKCLEKIEVQSINLSIFPQIPRYVSNRQWYLVSSESWTLPIIGHEFLRLQEGDLKFCPITLTPETETNLKIENYRYLSPCYKKSHVQIELPLKFKAKLEILQLLPGKQLELVKKDTLVYCHGYLDPLKWHYGVWKHVLAIAPSLKKSKSKNITGVEREHWYNHFRSQLSDERISSLMNENDKTLSQYFCNCIENSKNSNCRPCGEETFNKTDCLIGAICEKYYLSAVTLLKSEETKSIEIESLGLPSEVKAVEIKAVKKVNGKGRLYQLAIFRGLLFFNSPEEWILHIAPVTHYFPHFSKSPSFKISSKQGVIRNVQSI